MHLLPAPEHRWQDACCGRGVGRDLELTRLEADDHAHGSSGFVCMGEGGARLRQEALSRHRETDSSWQPLQKRPAKLSLQRADLL